ncbi:MAG: hypothetical protein RJB66_2190 [Pseudomonadota bacterium]
MGYDTFHSVGNYTANGDIQSLPTANSFWQTTNLDFAGRYTFDHSWALTAGVNHTTAHTSLGNFSQTQSGMQSVRGSFEYRFDYPGADIGLEGIGLVSILSIDQGSTKPIYGDGAHGFGGNLWFLQKYDNIQVQAKGGFLYRSSGLSSLIPYEIGAHWRTGDLLLGAVGEGAWSAGPDQESELVRASFLSRTSAGSMNFRSFNPSYHFIDFQAKWNATNQFSITGGLGTTWMGKNFSQGNRYFLGINILWQVIRQSVEKSPLKNIIVKPPKAQKNPDSGPLYQEEDYEKQLGR